MRIELNEVIWLESETLSFGQLVERSGLPDALLQELVQAGGIEPLDASAPEPQYGVRALDAARRARRLREDFELDVSALLLVLELLDRMGELEARLQELQVKLPRNLR
jgi:chaperone modulatory protein CbpM